MDRYAVLGQPVAHSLSPRIHKAFAEQLGIALSYEAMEVAPEQFVATLQHLHVEGYKGLNITLPHKLAAFAACADKSERAAPSASAGDLKSFSMTPAAALAGSVNTLIRTADGWRGDNTDGVGLIRELKENLRLTLTGKQILLLGAGGAVRGILKPLLDEKPAELTLSNRNPWKPEKIAAEFKPYGNIRPCTHLALKGDRFDLVINATSAGHQGEMVKLPGQLLAENGACYDLSYGKAFEPFKVWAQAQNAKLIADGLGMLVEQAAASFELWRNVRPKTAPVLERLRTA